MRAVSIASTVSLVATVLVATRIQFLPSEPPNSLLPGSQAFGVDMFGAGRALWDKEEAIAAREPLRKDRLLMAKRWLSYNPQIIFKPWCLFIVCVHLSPSRSSFHLPFLPARKIVGMDGSEYKTVKPSSK